MMISIGSVPDGERWVANAGRAGIRGDLSARTGLDSVQQAPIALQCRLGRGYEIVCTFGRGADEYFSRCGSVLMVTLAVELEVRRACRARREAVVLDKAG